MAFSYENINGFEVRHARTNNSTYNAIRTDVDVRFFIFSNSTVGVKC